MRLIHRLACLAVMLVFARDLRAQNAQWFEARSAHFVLFTDTSAAKGRQLLADFESRAAEMEKAFGAIPPRQFPIEVFLFKKTEDFNEVIPVKGEATIDKSAYMFKGPDRIFVAARDKSPDMIANDVGHALGHVLFERYVWWRPFWLSEGAAELFRTVGREPDRRKITPEEAFTVADLVKAVPSATYQDSDPAGVLRIESHRLLRIAMTEYSAGLRSYVEALRTESGAQAKLALDNVDALSERLVRDAETRINSAATSDVQATAAESARVAIHRGDLLLAVGKTAEAGRWYNADTPDARSARAVLTRFSRSIGEATRSLDRAARELPDSGLVQFHFGVIETEAAADLALQAAALERAVKLLPLFGRADAELARVYTALGMPDAALPLLDRALQLEPEFADRSFQLRAEALLALRRYDDARKAIQTAAALPHSDRPALEAYDRRVAALSRRIDDIRQQAEAQYNQQLRSQVEARAAAIDPPKPVPAPPPPERNAIINYTIESISNVEVVEPVYPNYPDELVQKGKTGKVTLQVNIGANGRVTQATVANSQLPEMNAASIEAVKKWSFKPVLRAGQAVPFTIKLVFDYVSQ